MVAHNEDWCTESKDDICILKKFIWDLVILEIFYYNTFWGNSISVNSNGIIQAVNTLTYSKKQKYGIPRNVISRWLSETINPIKDFKKFKKFKRSAWYNHNFISSKWLIWDLESSSKKQIILNVTSPFIHTNHCLSNLNSREENNNLFSTFERYEYAKKNIKKTFSVSDCKKLMHNNVSEKNILFLVKILFPVLY